tara:strand:+ start:14158 stop:15183 length:1026 start_codon:yes stop_codon:yes gene_type:complete
MSWNFSFKITITLALISCLHGVSFANQKHIINNAINEFKANPDSFINNYNAKPDEINYKHSELESKAKDKTKTDIHAIILNDNYLLRDKSFDKGSLQTDSNTITSSQNQSEVILNDYADCSKNKNNDNSINCDGQKYCVGDECAENNKAGDFELKNAITKFSVIDSTIKSKPQVIDANTPYIFSGRVMKCRKYGYGFADCCKDSGWGTDIGLKDCNKEEEELGYAKDRQVVIYIGKTKKEGKKKKQKKVYCAFDTKLAKIIQEQGRRNQLGIGFGDAKHPNCIGISTIQLSSLNLDGIDLSPVINDVMNGRENRDTSLIKQKLMQDVNNQYQDYTSMEGEF